jgi:hypothetical protein
MGRILHSERSVQRAILTMMFVSVVIASISVAGILSLYFADTSPSSQISSGAVVNGPEGVIATLGQPGSTSVSSVLFLSTENLQLTSSVSSAEIEAGQTLDISVSLFNTLPTVNSVPTSNLTAFQGFPIALWPTCFGSPPVQSVVLSGNYSLDELRADANATGSSPSVTCAQYGMIINSLVFQPSSDRAILSGVFVTAVGAGSNATRGPYSLTSNFTVDGYWSYPFTHSENQELLTPVDGGPGMGFVYPEVGPSAAHPFVAGTYTLVMEDEWGQVELLHFTVIPATSTFLSQFGLLVTPSIIMSRRKLEMTKRCQRSG